jgi:hypothetical protein
LYKKRLKESHGAVRLTFRLSSAGLCLYIITPFARSGASSEIINHLTWRRGGHKNQMGFQHLQWDISQPVNHGQGRHTTRQLYLGIIPFFNSFLFSPFFYASVLTHLYYDNPPIVSSLIKFHVVLTGFPLHINWTKHQRSEHQRASDQLL